MARGATRPGQESKGAGNGMGRMEQRGTGLWRAQRRRVWGGLRSQRSSSNAGWIIPSVTVVPLLLTGVLLGLRCTFPSLYR